MEFIDTRGRPLHLGQRVQTDDGSTGRITEMRCPLTATEAGDRHGISPVVVVRPFSASTSVKVEGVPHEDGYCLFDDIEVLT